MLSTTQHFFKSRNLRLRNQYSIPINTTHHRLPQIMPKTADHVPHTVHHHAATTSPPGVARARSPPPRLPPRPPPQLQESSTAARLPPLPHAGFLHGHRCRTQESPLVPSHLPVQPVTLDKRRSIMRQRSTFVLAMCRSHRLCAIQPEQHETSFWSVCFIS
jgi:hypothetical protein